MNFEPIFGTNPIGKINKDLNSLIGEWNSKKVQPLSEQDLSSLVKKITTISTSIIKLYSNKHEGQLSAQESVNKLIITVNEIKDLLKGSINDRIHQQTAHVLLKELNKIDEMKLKEISQYNTIIEHFVSTTSFEKPSLLRKFLNIIFSTLKKAINSQVFIGYSHTKKMQEEQAKLENLEKMISVNSKEISKLESGGQSSSKKIMQLKTKNEELAAEKGQIEERLQMKREKYIEPADKNLANLQAIGGEPVKLELQAEAVSLQAMHFSATSFRETLKKAGATSYHIEGETANFQGIAIPEKSASQVLQALDSLGLKYAGWTQVKFEEQILLIPDIDVDRLKNVNLLSDQLTFEGISPTFGELKDFIDEKKSTVLLTSGNSVIFENNTPQILAFLLRGMNVMTFNFRGYRASTGEPSEEGLKNDMEAAYQYLKDKHHVSNEKLLIKSLCMSGGPCAYLAARHPGTHLILDQTYADFHQLAHDTAEEFSKSDNAMIKGWLTQYGSTFYRRIAQWLMPNWKTKEQIKNVQGHIAIIAAEEDTFIKQQHIQENYQAAVKAKSQVHFFSVPGKHGASWLAPNEEPVKIVNRDDAEALAAKIMQDNPALDASSTYVKNDAKRLGPFIELLGDLQGMHSIILAKQDLNSLLELCLTKVNQEIHSSSVEEIIRNFVKDHVPAGAISADSLQSTIKFAKSQGINIPGMSSHDIEKLIKQSANEYGEIDLATFMSFFLQATIKKKNVLIEAYSKIVDSKILHSPEKINKHIDRLVSEAPEQYKPTLRTFLSETINIKKNIPNLPDETPTNDISKTYYGRLRMDQFLKAADLI